MMLTNSTSGRYAGAMKQAAPLITALALGLGGCVQVQAPSKPIEINLNVNIRQEVVYTLKEDAKDVIKSNPELFPK
jgi:YnbE-like lipoprotein